MGTSNSIGSFSCSSSPSLKVLLVCCFLSEIFTLLAKFLSSRAKFLLFEPCPELHVSEPNNERVSRQRLVFDLIAFLGWPTFCALLPQIGDTAQRPFATLFPLFLV